MTMDGERARAHQECFAAWARVGERLRLEQQPIDEWIDGLRAAVQAELGPEWMARWADIEEAHGGYPI